MSRETLTDQQIQNKMRLHLANYGMVNRGMLDSDHWRRQIHGFVDELSHEQLIGVWEGVTQKQTFKDDEVVPLCEFLLHRMQGVELNTNEGHQLLATFSSFHAKLSPQQREQVNSTFHFNQSK
ncbi:hypothetical protein COX08_02045 [Candidatus Beckwithbacteria bacterium CG23_combo_of_CG06-09_8_20_14_all_34_8]|uniref:Uncharacterized protein n=1 Tax=Candidatus Beckwithbacteria bacterium CG23_combo_of_CG06-09_8_20_14_all_34_8 TaxID=1974497 RepID=A0A2H0B6E0_9BACT|nr:MAG: hypothetical protein COX08_02045 [Candidatus Beckwithbacteria bacterium CG23_combo_of_CG06-09_8_20_14_all_34_8]